MMDDETSDADEHKLLNAQTHTFLFSGRFSVGLRVCGGLRAATAARATTHKSSAESKDGERYFLRSESDPYQN